MHSDTETDCDTQASAEGHLPSPYSANEIMPSQDDQSEVSIVGRALQEIKMICSLDLGAALEEAILLVLQKSAGLLVQFVTTIPELVISGDNLEGTLFVLSALLDASFLDRLLRMRTLFRKFVAQSNGRPLQSLTVVIWVDELLWELSVVVPQVAVGFVNLDKDKEEIARRPQSIRDQIRNDGLRSVVQLPELWKDIHLVLGSSKFSPASRRVALSLLFGSYVMKRRFVVPSVSEPIADHNELLASLHDAANQIHGALYNGVSNVDLPSHRSNAALLVALFAVISSENKNDKKIEPSYLLPQRYGCLLDLIIVVLEVESDSFYPLEKLDAPQRVLLMWGKTVPWAWSTWPDQRVANTEYIRLLTATWLCRMDDPIFEGYSFGPLSGNDELYQAFMTDMTNSSLVVQLYHDIEGYMDEAERSERQPTAELYKLLGKLTWALIQYLEYHMVQRNHQIESRIPDFAQHLLSIYSRMSLSASEDIVKSLILEALCLVNTDNLEKVLQGLLSEKPSRFLARLEEATRYCAKDLDNSADGSSLDNGEHIARVESLLSFFIILLLKGASQYFALRETVGVCLGVVFRYIRKEESFGRHVGSLGHTLLTALCACTIVKAKKLIPCSQDEVWLLAIHRDKHEIMTTGTFAKYVLMTITSHSDALLLLEAWDHFSAALVTIVDQQVPVEEEAIALLVVPAICQVLQKLLTHSNVHTKRLLASSLRTLTLREALKNVISDDTADAQRLLCLKKRLGNTAMLLQNPTEDVNNHADFVDIVTSDLMDYRYKLIYYRGDRHAHLMVIHGVGQDQAV